MALHQLLNAEDVSIEHLITSVNKHYDRVSMHGLRRSLMAKQLQAIGIPFSTIELPENPSMEEYDSLMGEVVEEMKLKGLWNTGFGDIFLEDLRAYRENRLKRSGITALFPLWKRNTRELAEEFIQLGFKAIVVCTKAELLGESFVGCEFNLEFINDLPDEVDPCGENGEFHTFCYDGPIFKAPIGFTVGEKTYREYDSPDTGKMGFWFCDLV